MSLRSPIPTLELLDVSANHLSSVEGFSELFPKLSTFICTDNQISSLNGLSNLPLVFIDVSRNNLRSMIDVKGVLSSLSSRYTYTRCPLSSLHHGIVDRSRTAADVDAALV